MISNRTTIIASWSLARREKLAQVLLPALNDGALPAKHDSNYWHQAAKACNPPGCTLPKATWSSWPYVDEISADALCEAVHTLLKGVAKARAHGLLEEILLAERLRPRHVMDLLCSEASLSETSQLKRSQSALQVCKMDDECVIFESGAPSRTAVGTPEPVSREAKRSKPSPAAEATSPMKRSQSASQIFKMDDSAESKGQNDTGALGATSGTLDAPVDPVEGLSKTTVFTAEESSPMKRSQSASQISKMGRVGSCGSLSGLVAPQHMSSFGVV
mmetsp:Transcript_18861/g.48198  ORF Transcript_18861/g.48198 Transcript_18861/m.48198 type:complete len:274 (-) Transcript_18861:139-960(-)